jgi:hypothetical protein
MEIELTEVWKPEPKPQRECRKCPNRIGQNSITGLCRECWEKNGTRLSYGNGTGTGRNADLPIMEPRSIKLTPPGMPGGFQQDLEAAKRERERRKELREKYRGRT